MAGSKRKAIEYYLSLKDNAFRRKLNATKTQLSVTAKSIARDWEPVTGIFSRTAKSITLASTAAGTAATAGGFFALQAVLRSSVTEAMALDSAAYGMEASLGAANRQFNIGALEDWNTTLVDMRQELKIFSETDLRNTAARTIDMTKRLGLSEEQMKKVMTASANLGAGKFQLVDSVERVTAALRGEAEASEALGLTLNETYVKAWHEANNATGKAWKDLTDLEKAQVRYNILMEQAAGVVDRAAGSYDRASGVASALAASYQELKTSIGAVVTQNSFFIKAGQLIDEKLQSWKAGIDGNKAEWMLWSKQSILSVLEFSAEFADGMDAVYRAMKKVSGVLSLSWAGTARLGQGFQLLFEKSNKFFGDNEQAEYWAQAQVDSAAIVEKALAAADDAFQKSDRGLEIAGKAASKIRALKEELAKIEAKPVNETATATGAAALAMEGYERKVVKVGEAWKDVWLKTEETSSSAIDAIVNKLEAMQSRDWTVDVPIKEVQAKAMGGLVHMLAAGGHVAAKAFAVGGRVTGPGGIDKVPAWLTAGEVVIKEPSVRAAGLRAALAYNAGNWPVVIEELTKKIGSRFNFGGLVGQMSLPPLPELPKFAGGGLAVAGAGGGTVTMRFEDIPSGNRATAYAAPQDASAIERMFKRRARMSSR